MKYFVMYPDNRLKNAIKIKLTESQLEKDHAQVIPVDLEPNKDFPDFIQIRNLTKSAFIVSDLLKNMLDSYADAMSAEPFILADQDRRVQKNYWKVHLEKIDCIRQDDNEMFFKKKEIVIDESKTMEKLVFSVHKGYTEHWIASLPFAENFLRKNMFGVEWIPLHTINEGGCITDE